METLWLTKLTSVRINAGQVFASLSALYLLIILATIIRTQRFTQPPAHRRSSLTETEPDTHEYLLCLFTTFKADPRKSTVINNTLHNWASLDANRGAGRRRIRPIMYVVDRMTTSSANDDALVTSARQLGWSILPISRVSSSGLPFVKDMYSEAAKKFPNCTFYALSNGDILFSDGLIDSLHAVAQRLTVLGQTLVIGRRWNVRLVDNETLYLPEQISRLVNTRGKLHKTFAVDYFIIARNEFPWHRMPDVVIARRGYDNYLVMLAVRQNVSVIDSTQTMVAVHQTDREAKDVRRHSVDYWYNMHRLPRFNYRKGYTSSAQYFTTFRKESDEWNATGTIVIRSRLDGQIL